ncbi:MAG: TIGR00366 family protein [Negativicutes bacterium]|nr:TIGR00366 family protein [Negativicutes bacterium]
MQQLQVDREEKVHTGFTTKVISVISDVFSELIKKYLPDPFLFAVILTIITGLFGIVLQNKTPLDMIAYWGQGFWGLLTFAMQMILVMIGGSVLAQAPIIQRFMDWFADIPKTPKGAIALATFFGGAMSYLNWGFGLIAGTLLAKKLAERVPGVHYPLIIASSYTGFGFYAFGISSSAPLLIATSGHFLEKQMGIIPISQTLFHPINIMMAIAMLVVIPLVNSMIKPQGTIFIYKPEIIEGAAEQKSKTDATPAERAESNPIFIMIAGAMGIVFIVYYFFVKKGTFDINIINFIFLFLAIIFHGTTRNFINAVQAAGKGIGSMAIQFPFYAGIMGMMTGSGLVTTIAGWFVAISTPQTLPFWGWVSSMFINIFVPSGGGHWVVQGPFMIEAAKTMGANVAAVSMSVALGNGVQDIIQPMWVLPALAMSGLGIRDIMGYNVIAFICACVIVGTGILAWGFISV